MEEFREVAKLHYKNSSEEIKNEAKNYFNSMKPDKHGRISQAKFIQFLEKNGSKKILPDRFVELDKDGDGNLNFDEVLTMYYMATNCIFCDGGCGKWVHGMYFTCLPCFDESENSFNLCFSCYREQNFKHSHNDGQFLDNYSFHNYMKGLQRSSNGPNSTQSEKNFKMERRTSTILEGINAGCALGSTGLAIGTAAAAGVCNIM